MSNRSPRPHSSPAQTPPEIEDAVVALRKQYPVWGGRKLRAVLLRQGVVSPSASTITSILRRHDLLVPKDSSSSKPWKRFEAPFPNALWQMDYKGHFALVGGGRCHPLTVLDDHARYSLGVRALSNERGETVKTELISIFRRYGLPNQILCDNGTPWSVTGQNFMTRLTVWLLHLDVITIHGQACHPQTQGKDERFHRTLKDEVLATRSFKTLEDIQEVIDAWRQTYNHVRPHEALGLVPPGTRYTPSLRSYPEQLPDIVYPDTDIVRKVTSRGVVKLGGRFYYVGEAFYGYPVGIRATGDEGIDTVYFRHYAIAQIDRRASLES